MLAAALGVGCALRIAHLGGVEHYSPDENFYTYFAAQIADHGPGAMRPEFAKYNGDSVLWNYPSPTRIGHLPFVVAAMEIGGVRDQSAGVAASFIFSCMSLFLLAWIGVRFFNPWVAIAAVAFLGSSVGELGMSRRAWQDSPFGFFGLLGVYLTCAIISNPRRIWPYPAFLAAGVMSLLTKQTGVISYGVCAIWLLGYLIFGLQWWREAILLALGGIASIAVTLGVWSMLAGSMSVALLAATHSIHPTSLGLDYLEYCCTGPWYHFFYLLWIVGPLPAVLALFGAAVSLFPRRLLPRVGGTGALAEPSCAPIAAWMTIGFFGYAALYPGMQCLRYISPADGTFALLAALGLWYLLALARRAMSRTDHRLLVVLAVLGVVIAGARDYRIFTSVVVGSGMPDLSVTDILKVMNR
jgi:hypothetical protein